jgi:hypothetical protein
VVEAALQQEQRIPAARAVIGLEHGPGSIRGKLVAGIRLASEDAREPSEDAAPKSLLSPISKYVGVALWRKCDALPPWR